MNLNNISDELSSLNLDSTDIISSIDSTPSVLDDKNVNKSLKMIMGLILNSLTPALCKQLSLKMLDVIEDLVKKTDTKVDDMIIGAFVNKIRELLNEEPNTDCIIDNDEINNMITDKIEDLSNVLDNNIQTTLNISDPSTMFDDISTELNKYKKVNPFEN